MPGRIARRKRCCEDCWRLISHEPYDKRSVKRKEKRAWQKELKGETS